MENKKKCSFIEHKESEAIIYCQECNIDMCNKCSNLHQQLFYNHHIYNLDKNNTDEIFINFCKEKNHPNKLQYYCKDHNILCCANCIAKIDGKGNGKHNNCSICFIENIKEEKKNKLNENIKYLEELSIKLEEKIKELKSMFEKINENKEELKLKIQKIFTNIRNVLNQREDELLLEVDKQYNELFCDEEIINKCEKLPKKVKVSLEKGKSMENEWKDDNKLNSIIDGCINIENDIKTINLINESIDKIKTKENAKLYFIPENNDIEILINNIKKFEEISQNNLVFESLIINNKEDLNKFKILISSRIKIKNMKLLYRSTKDGLELQNLKNKIEGKSNLIFLFLTGKTRIFGCFISSKLDNIQNKKIFKDENAFVFSLNNNQIYKIIFPEKAIDFCDGYPILVGNDWDSNGFWIYKDKVNDSGLLNKKIYDFKKKSELTEGLTQLTEFEVFEIN